MKQFISFLVVLLCCACSLAEYEHTSVDVGAEAVRGGSLSLEHIGHTRVTPPFLPEEVSEFLDTVALPSTHKAIRVLPRSMEQLHSLERDSTLFILYHPFDSKPAPDEEYYDAGHNNLTGYQEVDIIEECQESCDESDAEEISMEPIYVFWPNSRAIPADINYEFCYDATIPEEAFLEGVVSRRIEQGNGQNLRANLGGRLMTRDNRLAQYVALGNARIYYYSTSSVLQYTSTDAAGYFVLVGADINNTVSISLINDKFAVRDSLTSNVISFSLGQLSSYMISDNYAEIKLNVNFKRDVFKAASYYFYGSNSLLNQVTRYDSTGNPIDIFAINHPSDSLLGRFSYYPPTSTHLPFICIWNNNTSDYSGASSKVFGTVLHELGHATNYASYGFDHMKYTDSMIKESFASFFGWYNVKEYYSSVITSHSDVNDICTQGRQDWHPGGGNYTPLYIDLYDNYNQHLDDSRYNDDQVSGFPVWVIKNLGLGPQDFQSVFKQAYSYVGTYFSSSDECFEFMAPYIYLLPSIRLVFN